ncbi:deoxyribodipyrimidine photo-lyase [Halonotius terrestris]|uniref:Deoxyribodipyrimidine photo-lyase n=1 Tax=Halonotius terrestris TaxID=2487750 RepID=A0A8J8TDN8_9EURY|nr:deoxyribodipyrimidine photo-lyase [Halonotius terrestris]TQQ83487.1 deoxyribodipyrimidine photo-lyase [Halonotius terrestris]
MTEAATPISTAPTIDAIPAVDAAAESGVVVWHRRGLRTADHPALTAAVDTADRVLPLFVFDPTFYRDSGLACDARSEFLHESLAALDSQYDSLGGGLTYAHGDPVEILSRFRDQGWQVVASAEPTGRYGRERDNAAAAEADVEFVAGDGLIREAADTREGWSDHVEAWFTADQHAVDSGDADFVTLETPLTPDRVADAYDIDPTKERVPRGGREAGRRRLHHFADSIRSYPGNISAPSDAEDGTSRLSPYLRFGCLSVREVYQHIDEHAPDCRGKQMFISRLYWNRHYTQKLADWPGWLDTAVNPVMEEFHADNHDPALVDAWKQGQTGYPMVDASMRCLRETGWLNFRMRAMCASFLCDLCQQPWQIGADWFYYHLIDADPAINYTQFQTQAGVVGTNMLRIYNPRKQVRDNDPDGEFIREWVPELRPLPDKFLDQPEKTPLAVQDEYGVDIGDDYPYPIVEYEAARERIQTKLEAVRDDARRALQRPEVAERASLSRRGRGSGGQPSADEATADTDDDQASLSEF